MTTTYVNWGESRVKLTWKRDNQLPINEFITSVHGFCFRENKLLLVDLNHRGWDFPGGHIEPNETPKQCFKREAMEEGYVQGKCKLLGILLSTTTIILNGIKKVHIQKLGIKYSTVWISNNYIHSKQSMNHHKESL